MPPRFLERRHRRLGHAHAGALLGLALGLCLAPLAAPAAGPAPAHQPLPPPVAVADLGHANGVSSLAIARTGKLLATGGADGLIKLWDVASGRLIRNFPMHGLVTSLAFTAGDRQLVGSDSNGELVVWDPATGTKRRHWRRPGAPGFPQVEADGTIVELTRAQAGSLVTLRSPRGDQLARLPLPAGAAELALDPARRRLAFSGSRLAVEVRPLAGGAPAPPLERAPQNAMALRFSPDGLLLGASDEEDAVTFWDLRDGHRLRTVSCAELAGKSSAYYPCFFNFLPDGRRAAIAFIDHVAVVDPRTGERGDSWTVPQAELGGLAAARDGSALFVESGNGVEVLGLGPARGRGRRRIEGRQSTIATLAFGDADDRLLAAGQRPDDGVTLWDLERGRPVLIHPLSRTSFSLAAVSRDSRFFAVSDTGDSTGIEVWDAERRATLRRLPPPGFAVGALALSDDAEVLAAGGADPQQPANEIALYRPGTPAPCILAGSPKSIWNLALSSDRRWLASASGYPTTLYGSLKLWDAATCQLRQDLLGPQATVAAVAFGGHDHWLASGAHDVRVWNVDTGKLAQPLAPGHFTLALAFSRDPDARLLAAAGNDGVVTLWEWRRARVVARIAAHASQVYALAFSHDGRTLATGAEDGAIRLWDVSRPARGVRKLCDLTSTTAGSWIVLDPAGRFDSNDLETPRGLHWLLPAEPLRPLPLEIFLRDYYRPRLLASLLARERLPPVRPLAGLDRSQPQLAIAGAAPVPGRPDLVAVDVEVRAAGSRLGASSAAAYDLRLFRDGQLVGAYPQAPPQQPTAPAAAAAAALAAWRAAHAVPLGTRGRATVPFVVRLPHTAGLRQVELSAYAFNRDRIKTGTARTIYPVPAGIVPARPRAYLVTVGVSENQNPAWRLRYAARDARLLATVMAAPLAARGYEVVTVGLVSPRTTDGPGPGEVPPTKAILRATLAALASRDPAAPDTCGLPAAVGGKLRPAQPEDVVLLFVAAHGDTDRQGRLDLYPYDLGSAGPVPPDRRISSDELAAWLRDVDAGQLILILDTCRAGAVTGRGFRAGPMGDPGLGQLAYDKRARILAAAQADAEATGSFVLQQGLLTHALAREALANLPPASPAPFPWQAWLRYAERRVPELFREYVAADRSTRAQVPALFDFAASAADLVVPPPAAAVPTPPSR
jgi:WD40 repeat protein/uncharacterized caspase-like protein